MYKHLSTYVLVYAHRKEPADINEIMRVYIHIYLDDKERKREREVARTLPYRY